MIKMDADIIYTTPLFFCLFLCCCVTCLKMFPRVYNKRRVIIPENIPMENVYIIVENPDDTICVFRKEPNQILSTI